MLDPAFGGPDGFYELPAEKWGVPALAVDSAGRPLLAQASRDHVAIRRLTQSGAPDGSFGLDGAVELDCRCEYGQVQLLPGPRGSLTVVLPRGRNGVGHDGRYGRMGTILTIIRLKADGSADRRFGRRGTSSVALRGAEPPVSSATSRGGALYLGGTGCCVSSLEPYVVRISARGRLDGRFTTASQQSLRSVRRLGSLRSSVKAVLIRRGGKLDLLGEAGYDKGFALRLKPNGRPHRRFAANGMRVLPLPVGSAALGSEGSTLAVSDEGRRSIGILMRLLPGGRMDRAFGPRGVKVPDSEGDSGMSVVVGLFGRQ